MPRHLICGFLVLLSLQPWVVAVLSSLLLHCKQLARFPVNHMLRGKYTVYA